MEILDLRGVDPTEDKPTRLNVWRPRKRPTRTEGEVFHEALPAAAAIGFALPEISESSVRITLATLATLASITVLGLTLAQLLGGGGAGAQPQAGENQPKTAQTTTPTTEPSAATTSDPATSSTGSTGSSSTGTGSGGGSPASSDSNPTGGTGGGTTVPDPCVNLTVGYICVGGEKVLQTDLQLPVPGL